MTTQDPMTGLPLLPVNYVWNVYLVYDTVGGYEPGEPEYGNDFFRIGMIHLEQKRFLFWKYVKKTEVAGAMITKFDRQPVGNSSELTPTSIVRAAESVLASIDKQKTEIAERERGSQFLGYYPPNKLGGKS